MYYVVSYCQSGKLPLMPCMAILPTGNLLLVSYGLVCFSFQLFDPPARQVVDSSTLSLGHVFRSTSKTLFGIITTDRCTNQWSARVVFSISRREWEFLRFNLVHRDETENSWHLLSGFETRPRKNFLQSRASRRDRDLLSSLSGFETRTRIPLIWSRFSRRDREFWNLPSFPEIRLERPHYFACNFWEANYIKCRAPHFARCSPILKWPSHVLRASILWFVWLLP